MNKPSAPASENFVKKPSEILETTRKEINDNLESIQKSLANLENSVKSVTPKNKDEKSRDIQTNIDVIRDLIRAAVENINKEKKLAETVLGINPNATVDAINTAAQKLLESTTSSEKKRISKVPKKL